MTELVFRDDAYAREAQATVMRVEGDQVWLDRTVFYGESGGQPGDRGVLHWGDAEIGVSGTRTGETKDEIVHVLANGSAPGEGDTVRAAIDWERRHRLMRLHTACHILSVVCPFPITGASISEDGARIDFDQPDPPAKDEVTARMADIVRADHPVFTQWITDEELAANPGLVKSANVRPPSGTGRIRLVCIGEGGEIDTQPCGGTHVRSTGEVGAVHIAKVEKKGRTNRRFRIRFGEAP